MSSNLGKIRRMAHGVGHGLHNRTRGVYDPGMDFIGPGDEHTHAEAWAKSVSKKLAANGHPQLIIEDTPLYLKDDKARAFKANYFFEWHFNASVSHTARGAEVYVPTLASPAWYRKADSTGRAIARSLGIPYRGTHRTNKWAVFNFGTKTALIEICFGDNMKDVTAYNTYHAKAEVAAAKAILFGIQDL